MNIHNFFELELSIYFRINKVDKFKIKILCKFISNRYLFVFVNWENVFRLF